MGSIDVLKLIYPQFSSFAWDGRPAGRVNSGPQLSSYVQFISGELVNGGLDMAKMSNKLFWKKHIAIICLMVPIMNFACTEGLLKLIERV